MMDKVKRSYNYCDTGILKQMIEKLAFGAMINIKKIKSADGLYRYLQDSYETKKIDVEIAKL